MTRGAVGLWTDAPAAAIDHAACMADSGVTPERADASSRGEAPSWRANMDYRLACMRVASVVVKTLDYREPVYLAIPSF